MPVSSDFADFCCELLSSVGPLRSRRMFGGWGLSLDGLTIAIVADLGGGDKLWLKADADTRAVFEAAGCARFTYPMRQGDTLVDRSMNYYCPPDDAMDAPHAMASWARLALESALKARAAAPAKVSRTKAAAPRKAGAPAKTPPKVAKGRKTRSAGSTRG
ncbi:MAG: TfoX/Sxy family protein [Rhodoferax sp.]|jgi:DNA transformation protein|nr:TfoX/Sxy family protein [Rhodoferax sp.]